VQLADPGPTALDLRFRLFRTPVRVHPMFWLCMAIFGWSSTASAVTGNILGDLIIWILCAFVSILLHEFGHVLAFQIFGNNAHIVLYMFGGLAIPDGAPRHGWQRIIVSAAGPGAQLLLYALIRLALWQGGYPESPVVRLIFRDLLWINLFWPLFNLLPIYPLDGGQIAREVCLYGSRANGVIVSLWLSLILAAGLAINGVLGLPELNKGPDGRMQRDEEGYIVTKAPLPPLAKMLFGKGLIWDYVSIFSYGGGFFTILFFGLLAYGNFQDIQAQQRYSRRSPWEEDDYDDDRWRR
jgi:Zn-dependent protease